MGLGYALGAKLALRDRPMFALIGDGAFHYNPVPSCLGVADEYRLPIHIVVFNNQRYLSMETSLLKYLPGGSAKEHRRALRRPYRPRSRLPAVR